MEQTTTGQALLDHFAALDHPRQQAKVLYPLPEIIMLPGSKGCARARLI